MGVVDHLPVQQTHDAGGILLRQLRVVGDHDHQTGLADLLQKLHHLETVFRIQGAGGFICQEDAGVVHQRPGNGAALHLPTGHLVRPLVELISQPHLFQGGPGPALPFRLAHAGKGEGQLHVPQHVLVGDKVVILKYEAHGVVAVVVPIPVLEAGGTSAADAQVSAAVTVQPPDDIQKGGLTAAGGAQYSHKLMFPEGQGHPPQGVDLGISHHIILGDILQDQHRGTILSRIFSLCSISL